ncbi:DNA ligase [[Clostridium] innocuum]|nr:DNA ligase [[Clostridium] innocuum]MCR0561275.1 DNA ligase [[Clostridium] innocuum]MCR0604575.1 DNA ligase [[Clostridium] innocuum]
MDLFEKKSIEPMLIAEEKQPFDSDDYIYELKIDGIRCIAYCDKDVGITELKNKRGLSLNSRYPELTDLHKYVKARKCILDGELYVFNNGRPDFFKVQRRATLKNPFKIKRAMASNPAVYTAFDILYKDGQNLEKQTLMERKRVLKETIRENERFSYSRYIENDGIALFELTKEKNLEGIVAKHKQSMYFQGKRSKNWIKCKHMMEDDFIILGYRFLEDGMTSLLLGKYDEETNNFIEISTVSLGVSYSKLRKYLTKCDYESKGYFRVEPSVVCTVKFMGYTEEGNMRQPSFKIVRDDKAVKDCTI